MTSTPASPPAPSSVSDAEDLIALLHARGQRVTPQRVVILRELRRRGRHATADEIRRGIRARLPGVSTPTVYAALELLVELGLIRRIDAGAGATLYDPRAEPHQHTACRRCGRVEDLDGAELELSEVLAACHRAAFDAGAVEVVVSGVCADCADCADRGAAASAQTV